MLAERPRVNFSSDTENGGSRNNGLNPDKALKGEQKRKQGRPRTLSDEERAERQAERQARKSKAQFALARHIGGKFLI
jgi:hypothetical protein